MLAYSGKRIGTEMKDGDIISEILRTGICHIGTAYLALGKELDYAYLLHVGLPEFDHTEISCPKSPQSRLSAIEYYGDGCLLERWESATQTPLADLVRELCAVNSQRHSERTRALAHSSLVRKGLVSSGRHLDSAYYRRCAKSASRALDRALRRRWRKIRPDSTKDWLEGLLAGVPLETYPELAKLDQESMAVDRAVQWLRRKSWELIPPTRSIYRSTPPDYYDWTG